MKIKDMTNQQIFDAVVEHAAKQYERAIEVDGSKCVYLAEDGNKCFVGALIETTNYSTHMEGKGVDALCFSGLIEHTQTRLLMALQQIHDGAMPSQWADRLIRTGDKHQLDTSGVIPKFKEYNRPC